MIDTILAKAVAGDRLSFAEGVALFECRDLATRAELLIVSIAKIVAGLNSEGQSGLN